MTLLDFIRSALGLGSSDDDGKDRSTDVTVEHDPEGSVEPDTASEAAVKGTDDAGGGDEPVASGTDATGSTGSITDESPADPDQAAEPAEASEVTEHAGTEHEAAEPAEAAGPATGEPNPEETEPAPVDESPESNVGDVEATDGSESEAESGSAAVAEEPPEEGAAEPAEATGAVTEEGDEHEAAEPAEAAGPVGEEPDAGGAGADQVDTVSGIGPAYAGRLADAGVETVAELAAADAADLAGETDISEKRLQRLIDRAAERLE
jgi:predicted flap endonuclease-1-like 5' DNA nuclease